jgi:hypothetical protein
MWLGPVYRGHLETEPFISNHLVAVLDLDGAQVLILVNEVIVDRSLRCLAARRLCL